MNSRILCASSVRSHSASVLVYMCSMLCFTGRQKRCRLAVPSESNDKLGELQAQCASNAYYETEAMTPLQRASLISVGFMLAVFVCFMTCVVVFFGIEWRKKCALQEHVNKEVAYEQTNADL